MSGYKSPQLKYVVSHHYQLYRILKNFNGNEDLNVCLRVQVEDFDYVLLASEHMKCFGCGENGHIIKMCLQGA